MEAWFQACPETGWENCIRNKNCSGTTNLFSANYQSAHERANFNFPTHVKIFYEAFHHVTCPMLVCMSSRTDTKNHYCSERVYITLCITKFMLNYVIKKDRMLSISLSKVKGFLFPFIMYKLHTYVLLCGSPNISSIHSTTKNRERRKECRRQ